MYETYYRFDYKIVFKDGSEYSDEEYTTVHPKDYEDHLRKIGMDFDYVSVSEEFEINPLL